MSFIAVYNAIIYHPLLNLLVFFYNIIPGHDIGVVIILITIFIRLLLAPSFGKSIKSQKAMNELQPKLNAVKEKYKDDKEGQAKAMMELYKENKINPFSSCLPLLLQLPILIGLYQAFRVALNPAISMAQRLNGLYPFIHRQNAISPYFFKVVNLSQPSAVLAIMAGLAQFWQSKLMMPKTPGQDATMKAMSMQTTYVLPVISAFIAWRLPAGLPLYWVVTTLFAVGQQYYIMRKPKEELGIRN
jgi:YidC/Oxa1 family membrane protein insertase